MIARSLLVLVATFTGLFLPACQTLHVATYPEITFTHLKPIKLNVRTLKIIDKFQPPNSFPNIEHQFPSAPAKVLKNWALDRIKPSGTKGTAYFSINDASVIETPLKLDKSISSIFLTEQSHKFNARVAVKLEIMGLPNITNAVASASATRSQTIDEGTSINKKYQLWFEMTESLMADFNTAMESSIRQHLGNLLL